MICDWRSGAWLQSVAFRGARVGVVWFGLLVGGEVSYLSTFKGARVKVVRMDVDRTLHPAVWCIPFYHSFHRKPFGAFEPRPPWRWPNGAVHLIFSVEGEGSLGNMTLHESLPVRGTR